MKIKEVCNKTGLTDRAIRFYIENGLLFPRYTVNYAGRKTYDFSDEDIVILKQISTLRQYDFSIDDIKELLLPEGDVQLILEEHISLLKEKTQNDLHKLESLVDSLNESPWTPEELCDSLSNSFVKPVIAEESQSDNELFLEKKTHNNFILSIVFSISTIVLFVLAIILTKNGIMNEIILSYFFAAEGLLGYYVLKNVFQYFKPQHHFIPYLIIVLIIYLIGTLSKYI